MLVASAFMHARGRVTSLALPAGLAQRRRPVRRGRLRALRALQALRCAGVPAALQQGGEVVPVAQDPAQDLHVDAVEVEGAGLGVEQHGAVGAAALAVQVADEEAVDRDLPQVLGLHGPGLQLQRDHALAAVVSHGAGRGPRQDDAIDLPSHPEARGGHALFRRHHAGDLPARAARWRPGPGCGPRPARLEVRLRPLPRGLLERESNDPRTEKGRGAHL